MNQVLVWKPWNNGKPDIAFSYFAFLLEGGEIPFLTGSTILVAMPRHQSSSYKGLGPNNHRDEAAHPTDSLDIHKPTELQNNSRVTLSSYLEDDEGE